MEIFWPIIVAVLIFIISQYILKAVIEPVMDIKKAIGKVGERIVAQIDLIGAGNPENIPQSRLEDLKSDFQNMAGELAGRVSVIPKKWYSFIERIFSLPPRKHVLYACGDLAMLAHSLEGEKPSSRTKRINKAVDITNKLQLEWAEERIKEQKKKK